MGSELAGEWSFSTDDQSLELQLDALRQAGAEKVFSDKAGSAKIRPGLDDALAYVREGDDLVVWKLDRLGRSVKGLIDLVGALQERGVQFRSLSTSLDVSVQADSIIGSL